MSTLSTKLRGALVVHSGAYLVPSRNTLLPSEPSVTTGSPFGPRFVRSAPGLLKNAESLAAPPRPPPAPPAPPRPPRPLVIVPPFAISRCLVGSERRTAYRSLPSSTNNVLP